MFQANSQTTTKFGFRDFVSCLWTFGASNTAVSGLVLLALPGTGIVSGLATGIFLAGALITAAAIVGTFALGIRALVSE